MIPIYLPNPSISIKNINKHTIIDMIRFIPGGVSRIELSQALGITRAGVTTIINDLLAGGVVREMNGSHGRSRRVALEINPQMGLALGIDIGATHISTYLADFSGRVIQESEMRIHIDQGPLPVLAAVDEQIHHVLDLAGVPLSRVSTMGIGVPGPINIDAGMVDTPPIMPGWNRYPIRDELQARYGIPVTLNNDAELGALGEWAYGAGRRHDNLAFVKVGSGIGAGLLLNGQIYRGSTGSAGEIGHITIDDNGPRCTCGNIGCLESLAGGIAIAQTMKKEIRRGQKSILDLNALTEDLSYEHVIDAAFKGDLLAQNIINDAGYRLGTAVASLVNLFNPGIVIVGGGVSVAGDILLEPMRKAVRDRSLAATSSPLTIMTSVLGKRAPGMGAVVQAVSQVLHRQLA